MNNDVQIDTTRPLRREFTPYVMLMGFLGDVMGPFTEILLHDVSDLSRSIIAIANGEMSGRSVGGPATDLVLKILQNEEYLELDYLTNYLAHSRNGGFFRSSTFFIRDDAGTVIGMLCFNVDDRPLHEARRVLERMTQTMGLLKGTGAAPRTNALDPSGVVGSAGATGSGAAGGLDASAGPHASAWTPSHAERTMSPAHRADDAAEWLSTSIDELTLDSVARTIARRGIDPERMTQDEKIETVRELESAGIFLLKGAVAQTAEALHVSEPTVYRYIKNVRRVAQA